jgi:hypothetical protein
VSGAGRRQEAAFEVDPGALSLGCSRLGVMSGRLRIQARAIWEGVAVCRVPACWAVFLLSLFAAGCSASTSPTATQAVPAAVGPIETTKDLLAALTQASGVVVSMAGEAEPHFGVSGEIIHVGSQSIEVYAFPDSAGRATAQSEIDLQGRTFQGRPLQGWVNPRIWGAGRLLVVYDGEQGGTFLLLSGLLGDPLTAAPAAPGPDEPYPPALSAALMAVAQAEGVDPGQIEVVSYSAATWPDGCLGLPGGGDSCDPGQIQGWQVTLKVGDVTFDVRTDELGGRVRWR